jgi:GT2 family glycosyltransferase
MISILIPTYNNLSYLKACIESIKKNSFYKNEILVHINEGNDGTLEYIKNTDIKFTHSLTNIGLCLACNMVSKKSKFDLILYSHDDMYFLPNWDKVLIQKVKELKTKKFYLSSIMINGDPKLKGHLNLYAGDTIDTFNEKYLLDNYNKPKHVDFNGSTWAPHLIHKDLWKKVSGFSEEFSPGAGSDPDLNLKLWNEGVRIFRCLNQSRVYHFGSVTIRKKKDNVFKKNQGSKANKIFLLKWGFSIRFFKKYYLKSHYIHNENLTEPNKNLVFYLDLFKDKILFYYYFIISKILK